VVAGIVREEQVEPFDRGAVAQVIERAARLAADGDRLSLKLGKLRDLIREADHWARMENRDLVSAQHVQRAVEQQIYRSDRMRERIQEELLRGTFQVSTEGIAIGQINGLSVLQLGDLAFGRPSRITARVWLGAGEVIDIEREVKLAGPLHSKGVLILAGFLGERYAAELPLSLSASLVFEQSYGGIEGDSASLAELYALLSAVAGVALRQSLAVTGSINQHGQVQAIGGVNEKIEAFFDLCNARGLSGDQGVVIPSSNVVHLMLRQDVVEAVRGGRFHVYAVGSVDDGIEILTGLASGDAAEDGGGYPEESFNRRVQERLAEMATRRKEFGSAQKEAPDS
jgi:predicted ATP-dependent protease